MKKRATTVRNYVIARLSEIGIQKNEGYTESIDATGTNGDGSSTPSLKSNCSQVCQSDALSCDNDF